MQFWPNCALSRFASCFQAEISWNKLRWSADVAWRGISADLNHSQTAACFKSRDPAASTAASFIFFRDRLSRRFFAAMDESGGQLCFLQYINFSSGRRIQSLLKISLLALPCCLTLPPPPPTAAPPKKRHLLIAQLHHIIGMLVMVSVPSNLAAIAWSFEMRNYRPGTKAWPRCLSSTVLSASHSALAWRSQLTV